MVRRLLLLVFLAAAVTLPRAGSFLVVDQPAPADAGVVLQGDPSDFRLQRGLEALKTGMLRELFVDVDDRLSFFGKTPLQYAQAFIRELPPQLMTHVHTCPNSAKSTLGEAASVARCLAPLHPARVLLITSDYHTRRALSVFRTALPRYTWFSAAAHDASDFGPDYWKSRQWLKVTFTEWQKLLFWYLVERWKVHPA